MTAAAIARRALSAKGVLAFVVGAVTLPALLTLPAAGAGAAPPRPGHEGAPARAANAHTLASYGQLPLAFVANAGQTEARVRYQAQAGGASFSFAPTKAVFAFAEGDRRFALQLSFRGANRAPLIEGTGVLPGRVNYLIGNDPAEWRTGLRTYRQVVYRELWPGIDLAFRGGAGRLKYEFRLAPGADVSDIRLRYRGAERLSLGRAGGLRIHTPLGILRDSRPLTYQTVGGRRVPVESAYTLTGSHSGYGFSVGAYDHRRPLVIDPGLVYSTFLGGTFTDIGRAIAADPAGNAYVTGLFGSNQAFVTKLDAAGSVAYTTILGGSLGDDGLGIAVDADGNALVTGFTNSSNFPTTEGAVDRIHNGSHDAFVTKLDAAGALVYSTYLGGSFVDQGRGIAVDAAGNAYVTGQTSSFEFPTSAGAFDATYGGCCPGFEGNPDIFVTKLDPTGSMLYSTFLGTNNGDVGFGIAADAAGNAYVAGTVALGFPTTPGAYDMTHNGGGDVSVTKLSATGSGLVYSTFVGGLNSDDARGVAVDSAGNAYVTGTTRSANFPTVAALDGSLGGVIDGFVTKLNPAGSALVYSTYLGGTNATAGFDEQGRAIAVDARGNAYVAGLTASPDFPTTTGAFDTTFNSVHEPFVTKLSSAGSLAYSTFLAGALDRGHGIALDANRNAYVTGEWNNNGTTDIFVTKLDVNAAPTAPEDAYSIDEDSTLDVAAPGVLANDSDADGDPLTAALVSGPANGALTLNADGSFTYAPSANFNGADSFTYRANDGAADSAPATVTITVNPVDDARLAVDDAYSVNEDEPLTVAAPGVLGNDSDADGDALAAVLVSGPAHGALALNADGSFTYTPNPNFNGSDSFTYTASDGTSDSAPATVTITVNPVNDVPVAADDAHGVDEDTALKVAAPGVLGNDGDADGDTLAAVLVSAPAHGALTLSSDGSFAYTPDANFFGTDSFVYRANDGTAHSAAAMVTITVNPVNDAPVASADGPYLGIIGSPVTLDGSASSDVEGSPLTYRWSFGDGGTLVTTSPNPTHTYAAAGIYTVTLVVNDGSLDSAPTTTTATIGDPIGSNRGDVDAFLSYAAPTAKSVDLPAGTTSFDVTIIYGATIVPATFAAELNGSPFAGFSPAPGTSQTVTIPLSPGRNVLALSVDGTLPDGRTATDRDRLTLVAPPPCTPGTAGCGWKDGQLVTYNQDNWGSPGTTASTILINNFIAVYPNGVDIGIIGAGGNSASFTTTDAVFDYLPASGPEAPLNNDSLDATSTSSGVFGGYVLALQFNVDLNDANALGGTATLRFGDLRLCGLTTTTGFNDQTVRQILAALNQALGGGTTPYTYDELANLALALTESFESGAVGLFAQQHLFNGKCP